MPYPNVFSPITINQLEIKNRIIRSAHGTGLSAGGLQVLVDYHGARAKGGVGLTILEVASVHPTCAAPILAFRPEVVSDYEQLAEASHRHGMRLFQQLWHSANNGMTLTGEPPWAPSRVMGALATVLPLPMTKAMIDEVIEGYVTAARHCKEGGLDGVELHGAHGYLVTQFMSPVTNRREDDYGGSFENRMRFPREVIATVRSELGDDYPLGIRLTGAEGVAGGHRPGVEPRDCARPRSRWPARLLRRLRGQLLHLRSVHRRHARAARVRARAQHGCHEGAFQADNRDGPRHHHR